MGIKKASLLILVFILLSSTVYAVGFEWALGFPRHDVGYAKSYWDVGTGNDYLSIATSGKFFAEPDLAEGFLKVTPPYIAINGYGHYAERHRCEGNSHNRCNSHVKLSLSYQDSVFYENQRQGDNDYTPFDWPIYSIVDYAHYFKSHGRNWCERRGVHCWPHGSFNLGYSPIVTSGFESVFPKDNIQSIGPVNKLIPSALLPENETIYVGVYTKIYGDVLFWFGPAESEPAEPLKRGTNDYFDYINFCSDLNHNKICDYLDAAPCYEQGADWYGDPEWVAGVCCGADPAQLKSDTGLPAINCTQKAHENKAYCGIDIEGNFEWAPRNEVGSVHELLKCPGYSMVSDGTDYIDCEPGSADAKFFTIENVLGAHGYLCSNGDLFECKGDGAAYSWDKDFVADTGLSTNDLVGSGGCPPKILAYWPLDDGTARDTKGAYAGNIEGGSSTAGKINGAIHLELGDKIILPAGVPVEGDQFTVEAWIKPVDTAGVRNIIEKEDSFRIMIDDDILVGAVHSNQPLGDFGSRRVVANVWHHVALTYDGDMASLYLDGTAVTDSTHSGDIVWSDKPIVIGGSFVGDVDEVAVYDRALRGALMKRHAKMPSGYCRGAGEGLAENYYCAGDAEWTVDLDSKDESSCNKAGFVWTGNFCCSEDDDVNEYYNDHDTPPADLAKVSDGGQTVSAHAGAQVSSAQIILTNKGQFATVKGPAKLVVETYSAESPEDIGACPPLGNPEILVVSPWEEKTVKILSLGDAGDPCRYRQKIITAEPFLALGGCWDKDFVPIGHFVDSKNIINYHGHFYSCGLPDTAPELQIQDTQNDGQLVSPASTSCSDIKLNARGAGLHVVCNPGGKWQFTNNSAATTSSEVSWDISGTNASQYGCCDEDQCWTGFKCVDIGDYYTDPVTGDSYYCEE